MTPQTNPAGNSLVEFYATERAVLGFQKSYLFHYICGRKYNKRLDFRFFSW